MIFKRKLYEEMLRWKNESNSSTALLLKGARRVGKTTLVKDFAQKEYRSYIFIDFSRSNRQIDRLFEDMTNLNNFFFDLQNIFQTSLYDRQSAIIFDEVQFQPLARQAIKHLVADGRYDYIETGSLISIRKNVEHILIPSEEESMTLYPMDFEEFLWATGKKDSPELLKQAFTMKRSLGEGVHRTWMRELRLYMLIGGMPQAVTEYIKTNNMQAVDAVKRKILDLYEDDFRKIDKTGQAAKIFRQIPAQLASNASRFLMSSATGERRTEESDVIAWEMQESGVITMAYHANDPNVGFLLSQSVSTYKLFINDTGLFITLAFSDKKFTENIIYQKLLSDKLEANLGYVYENLVAQMLVAAGNKLFYYTFPKDANHNYEIDFLLSRGNKLVPIEVKSSGYKTHKSLDVFCEKFSHRIGERILLYTKDYCRDGQTTCVPVYFTPFL